MADIFDALLAHLFADSGSFVFPAEVDTRAIVEHVLSTHRDLVLSRRPSTSRIVNSVIAASARIGDFALVRNSVVGPNCVVGAHAQVNWSFVGAESELPHMNNVAYSILGRGVLLGAGTVTSSRRLDGSAPHVRLPDGVILRSTRDRFGALIGDGSRVGSLVCLNPFTVLDPGTHIRPVQSISGYITGAI